MPEPRVSLEIRQTLPVESLEAGLQPPGSAS